MTPSNDGTRAFANAGSLSKGWVPLYTPGMGCHPVALPV